MKQIDDKIKVSDELFDIIYSKLGDRSAAEKAFKDLAAIIRQLCSKNIILLKKRDEIQQQLDDFFLQNKEQPSALEVVKKLKEIGYIGKNLNSNAKVSAKDFAEEIFPLAGPQLVVPADKANMVLNALNARWGSLDRAIYASNLIADGSEEEKIKTSIKYRNEFLDKLFSFHDNTKFSDLQNFIFDEEEKTLKGVTIDNLEVAIEHNNNVSLYGINFNNGKLRDFVLKHNNLMVEFVLDEDESIKEVFLESVLTFIIDLEDASHSAPKNKYDGYKNIKGIIDGTLECELRGQIRKRRENSTVINPETGQEMEIKRTALPIVRDVGPHLLADAEIILVDDEQVPEKILDCFITSLLGMRYHVTPKLHGKEEVEFTVQMWNMINQMQGLAKNANKLGIMNEETRTNADLGACLWEAEQAVFFANSGFMDYTGSFIDMMMNYGPIAPYRQLPNMLYKTSYEKNNVNVSLKLGLAQTGAGMWPKIKDMEGLLASKIEQTKALNDTGWSPSPIAAVIHAMTFHLTDDVRELQRKYQAAGIKEIPDEDMFSFPKADIASLSIQDIQDNINFAIHGLLAYAEPWIRRAIGCSGVKDLADEPLMEDRATARIKTAFVRNWLKHDVVSVEQVAATIKEMATLVDRQNAGKQGYELLSKEGDNVVGAVKNLVFNPNNYRHSYVEPYLYPAWLKEQAKDAVSSVNDDIGDWASGS